MALPPELSPTADLPRRLRMLLIAVDGRTESASFVASLPSFGDVLGMLESLRAGGYVESLDARPSAAAYTTAEPPSAVPAHAPAPAPQYLEGLRDLQQKNFQGLVAQQAHRPAHRPTVGRHADGQARPRAALAETKELVTFMCDFVTRYLPLESLEISLELERLPSRDVLIESLDGYEELLEGTGQAGQNHLRELRQMPGLS